MATTKTIQSVERAFSILEYLQQCGGGERSVKEIADALELNKSTAFGLINTLTTLGYLQQNADNQKYVLSLKLLSFSNTIKVQNSIIRTVHPYLEQISLKYGEIAHCGVAQGDSVIYVDKVESSRSLSINTQIGTKNYLLCTGVGKCILAYMPEDEQQPIVDPRQLQAELRHIRAVGYAMDNEEVEVGLSCVAVPVFSAPGQVSCSISISGMTPRVRTALRGGLLDDLRQASADISRSLYGYQPAGDLL